MTNSKTKHNQSETSDYIITLEQRITELEDQNKDLHVKFAGATILNLDLMSTIMKVNQLTTI